MTEHITSNLSDRVLHLQFNRPERKNAITLAMYSALAAALNDAAANPDVRVALISGVDGNFTSGNDLSDFLSAGPLDESHPVVHFLMALLKFPKPVVAAVDGVAIGIGTTLLLQCDLVYADNTARFQMPFVNLGLVPEYASSFLVPRLAGQAAAAELLLLGEMFNAEKAAQLGFVNAVEANVHAHARAQALRLAAQPPAAVRKTKALLRAPVLDTVEQVMKNEFGLFAELLAGGEFKEAATAFFEKRKPDFSSFN
ncbi:enoyl-CoA hydratase-related protein [Simiduia agarivorans]|uniref:Enoyl-CoA hydratase/isomerase family protein n=1 Tax=Simiduia agarivorans (strain DSM 21679 / JCM 13881 / BCRC 17597 / SA1) TaxID=1117647 RepID=K4KKA3_SIMAS|nr:enoyl-CoA hydratase-related protein [Simiduia agarivorans]AFU98463.1 enoyl-CoA hydratase/isomerase family protein [Simiduia agarivorans SA1 = DSM 21679]